jgi:hypothetical protein
LARAGKSEFGFGMLAATIDVIFPASARFFEYTAVQSRSVSITLMGPPVSPHASSLESRPTGRADEKYSPAARRIEKLIGIRNRAGLSDLEFNSSAAIHAAIGNLIIAELTSTPAAKPAGP